MPGPVIVEASPGAGGAQTRSISAPEFARAMDALGPFEPASRLAVALSGGGDSMALALLASRWARARRGRVDALTVDHRLRPAARDEARQVARWCAARGIAHHVLTWNAGAAQRGRSALQATARAARYRLLETWCRHAGVLHLMTAHHRDDQAETFLLRLGAHSGLAGLAAMAPVRESAEVRLLRPLLGFSRARLEAHLRASGQDWIADPSNADIAYARVRLRALIPELASEGFDAAAMAATAVRFGGARRAIEGLVAEVLARAAAPDPAGFVMLVRAPLLDGAVEVGQRALARVLQAVSGAAHAPRGTRLARLFAEIGEGNFRGRTLGGCRVLPDGPDRLLVCREPRAMAAPIRAAAGKFHWDGRFAVTVRSAGRPRRAMLGALGQDGWAALRAAAPDALETAAAQRIPVPVRATLPALYDTRGPVSVPHIGYRRSGKGAATLWAIADIRPDVPESLAGPRFAMTAGNL